MRLVVVLLLTLSLFAMGCTASLNPEDKGLLEKSLRAADDAKMACQGSADAANSAAGRAENAADRADEAAVKCERAAEKCSRMFEKRLYK
ncbi:MAG: alanine-zipper protein [Candidatus Magnetoovum sp. WYHC-5]|nr:alanine-zipper protein [Candidatus Magnetoovum sp. WYHC-5]